MTTRAESEEIRALRLSLLLVILFAAGAILVAMYSDSETMSLEPMSAVIDDVVRLNPDIDVVVAFRPAPAAAERRTPVSRRPPSRQPDGSGPGIAGYRAAWPRALAKQIAPEPVGP